MKTLSTKAIGFAVNIAYACKDTIGYLLAKAASHSAALSELIKKPEPEEKPAEKPAEKKEEGQQDSEEESQTE